MPYPSIVTTFVNPQPTDKLNSPSHSSIESAQNTGLTEVQTFVGTLSSAVGTLVYDIRSSNSNGGGHVQTANKGGTGQTSYTKGDILVATSTSVLAKLAVGTNDQAILADSTTASGIKWGGIATEKTIQDQTYTYAVASVLSGSVWGITFPNRVSVLSAGQSFVVKFPTGNTSSAIALQVSSLVALRIKNPDLTNPIVGGIKASMVGILENDGTQFQFAAPNINPTSLGAWASATADGNAYQVTTDSFLVIKNADSQTVTVLTDSANPPTTERGKCQPNGASQSWSITVPVRKNDYYKITGTVAFAYLIPLGT